MHTVIDNAYGKGTLVYFKNGKFIIYLRICPCENCNSSIHKFKSIPFQYNFYLNFYKLN